MLHQEASPVPDQINQLNAALAGEYRRVASGGRRVGRP